MRATSVPTLPWPLRIVGVALIVPALAALVYAGISFVAMEIEWWQADDAKRAAFFGSPYGRELGFAIETMFVLTTLPFGVAGLILLRRRPIFRCDVCDYVLDRA